MSQIGRNGRSEDATGAVRVFGIDTLSAKLTEFTTVVEDVGGYVFEMTALDDDIFWSQVADHPGGSFICAPASCRLGVPTVASGSNLVLRAVMASAFKRGAPLLAIIIGSTTSGFNLWLEIAAATASMIAVLESIPVFTASQPTSLTQASICFTTKFRSTSNMDQTTIARPVEVRSALYDGRVFVIVPIYVTSICEEQCLYCKNAGRPCTRRPVLKYAGRKAEPTV